MRSGDTPTSCVRRVVKIPRLAYPTSKQTSLAERPVVRSSSLALCGRRLQRNPRRDAGDYWARGQNSRGLSASPRAFWRPRFASAIFGYDARVSRVGAQERSKVMRKLILLLAMLVVVSSVATPAMAQDPKAERKAERKAARQAAKAEAKNQM